MQYLITYTDVAATLTEREAHFSFRLENEKDALAETLNFSLRSER